MNVEWLMLFLAATAVIFALPMTPALIEWKRRGDAEPLRVVRTYDGKVTYFAAGFRRFLEDNLPYPGVEAGNEKQILSLRDGGYCQYVGADGVPALDSAENSARSTRKMIYGLVPLVLPKGVFFETEMYAVQGIAEGRWNVFRALLSEADVRLGEGIDVIRWAHAEGSFECGPGSKLYGRVSSAKLIRLHRETVFGRMQAPAICFGSNLDLGQAAASGEPERVTLALPSGLIDGASGRWLVAGDLSIPARSSHEGNLVVRGRLSVGRESRIDGDIKGGRQVHIGEDALIGGAVVTSKNLHLGAGCRVQGPVVAEGRIVIDSGCVIGSQESPTTVTADEVVVAEGAVIHGSVRPRREGMVVAVRGRWRSG